MPVPTFQTLLWQQQGPVLTITLHRPQSLNTMTLVMRRERCQALDLADADDSVRAIVFTGSGRAYCAGFDLGGPTAFDPATQSLQPDERGRDGGGVLALRLFASTKPLVAAVNGAAVGIGASMLLPMDVRIAGTGARFGFVFARRGIVPDACASWFLPRVVGISRALEWSMSGRLFGAEEALAGGLLREVCEPDALLDRAQALALEISENSAPVSVALTRQLMWRMMGAAHPMDAHKLDSRGIQLRGQSSDVKEGIESFMQKRDPHFPNGVSSDFPADVFPPEPDFE